MLNSIRYFQAVVRCQSFTQAALECSISQSAISQQIRALESELDVQLLVRKGRRFELTPAGRYFYEKTKDLLSETDRIVQETKRIARNEVHELRLGMLRGMDSSAIRKALLDFSREYPKIRIFLMQGNHEDLYAALQNDQIDLAISDQRRAFSQHYVNDFLLETPFEIELREDHPLASLGRIRPSDLTGSSVQILASKEQMETEQAFWKDIVGAAGDFSRVESLEQAQRMVLANNQILLCEYNDLAVSPFSVRLPLFGKDGVLSRKYHAFWKKENSGYYVEDLAEKLRKNFIHRLDKKN